MDNHEKSQETEKFTKQEFFIQMKNLLEKAPKEVNYSVLAMEDIDSPGDRKEGIISLQGSPQNITFLYSEAFRRSHEIKEVVFDAVQIFKFSNSMKSPSSFLHDILRDKLFRD